MENKKKKYYQYYKNNRSDNQFNRHKYYTKRKKKTLNDNVSNIEENTPKKVLMIDEEIDFNEYSGLYKKKVINLDEDIVTEPVIENNLNEESMLIKKEPEIYKENKVTNNNTLSIENDQPKTKQSLIIRTKLGYVLGVLILVVALFGSSFAFFNYNKEDSRQADMLAGDAYVRVTENNLNLSLTKQYPRTVEQARSRNDNYIDFHVVGKNTSLTKVLGYKFTLINGNDVSGKNRINPEYILFDLAVLDSNDNETLLLSAVKQADFNSANISGFYIPTETNSEIQRKYRIRAWISEEVSISDDPTENATYTQAQYANLYANFKVHVNSQDRVLNIGSEAVIKAVNAKINAETNACNPIWVDNMDTPDDDTDDITYFSGTNDCVDMNYVWYSGKLWRITAIYPDGAMKLITQNNITSIAFNESGQVNFYTDENTTSYMYQWLNEDFYDTLYNASEFIDNTKQWNATMPADTTISTKPAETNMVAANVGLLNSYEYYNSYRNLGSYSNGYLNIKYHWCLLNPYNALYVWVVEYSGNAGNGGPTGAFGGRPSIYLKSGLEFTGSGTKNDPYKIVGDKAVGKINDFINTRLSGEYVKLKNNDNEQMFRIIGVEDNKTKIIAMDYADNKATRKFATSTGSANTLWGAGTTTGTDTWYTYLNSTYYPNLVSTYGNLFDSDTYYLGTSGYNYKLSVCANTTSGNTKVCDKTTQTGTFDIGLLRYGEMFASQQAGGLSKSINMWLMNRYSARNVWGVLNDGLGSKGDGFAGGSPTSTLGVCPTLHLKSSVKIIEGSGTENDPYVVGL